MIQTSSPAYKDTNIRTHSFNYHIIIISADAVTFNA